MSEKKLADRLCEALHLITQNLDCSYPTITPPQ